MDGFGRDCTASTSIKPNSPLCKSTLIAPVGIMELSCKCRVLGDQGILKLGQSRDDKLKRVTLQVDQTDVIFSLQVWDAVTGAKQYTFEGYEAPVCSVCPHFQENIQFIFSTATDGKIKASLYDNMGSRVDYDAPGHSSTTMAYSADGTRLFSCGTNKEGDSYIVEWNESEGAVKRTYNGLGKRSVEVVRFDTTKNCFLAAGDEFMVKFWDIDNVNLLTTTDADGGLPLSF